MKYSYLKVFATRGFIHETSGSEDFKSAELEATKPGNGARTSDYYQTKNIPERFNNPDIFQGYNAKTQHPMYMTSSMEYGSRQPTVHTMPKTFHAKCQKFSDHLGKCGMYRDHSLNTSTDKSFV